MSDQDFFFDEEDEAVSEAPKASSKSGGKTQATARQSAPKSRAAAPAQVAPAPAAEKQVSMTVAALMAVVSLLLGVIIGFVLPGGTQNSTTSTGAAAGTGSTTMPGPLSEDQLSSGELPPGHPPVESMGATGAAEATATGQ